MKIEVKKIKFHPGHDDGYSYTAEVYVDGQKAFAASNDGWGGPDRYDDLPGYTGPSEPTINKWLAENTPKIKGYGMELDNSLELVVGEFLGEAALEQDRKKERRKYEGFYKKFVVGLRNGGLVTWKVAPTPQMVEQLKTVPKNADVEFLNFASDERKEAGLAAYCPDLFGAT